MAILCAESTVAAKYLALIVAAVSLAACETAKPPEAAAPSVFAPPANDRVVRSPIVPDDEPVRAASVVRASAPAKAPIAAPVADSATALSESAAAVPSTPGTEATAAPPPIAETSSSVAVSELPAPVATAPAASAPAQPSSISWLQDIPIGDVKSLMNANVGGFPLWLMVLIGFVLAAALTFGIGGKKEPSRESYAEPEAA
jgi:hypothetical protein